MATNYSNVSKDVRYTGRDFGTLKNNLVEFAKNYFPATVKDFTEASPSTMFIEMAAYVGDVLSYYTDYAMKETMLHRAQEKKNVYSLAQAFGYKPKICTPSTALLDVYCLIPSTGTGINVRPDYAYAPRIERGMKISTLANKKFQTMGPVDFAYSSSADDINITTYQTNAVSGLPEYYLFSKQVSALSGEQRVKTLSVGASQEYLTLTLADEKVQSIDSVVDSDGNSWTEVPYLAQETVFDETVNSIANDPYMSQGSDDAPSLLRLKTTKRRFATRITDKDQIQMKFGGGIASDSDETFLPNPDNVGSPTSGNASTLDKAFDPSNFLYSSTYGLAPSNTTLTITYTVGHGLTGNVPAQSITQVDSKTVTFNPAETLISGTRTAVIDSLYVENPESATGGNETETTENVRQNALAYHATQGRVVTREDYIVRSISMPARFGTVAKAYVASDTQMLPGEVDAANPLAVNIYTLTYDNNKKLTQLSAAAKENLRTYLEQYRMLTDAINIKDGYQVNIGIDFSITVIPGNNSNVVLVRAINALKQKMHIDNFTFSTPLYIKDIYLCIANVEGVQSVTDVEVKNLFGEATGYSDYRYNIKEATYQDVIYPSLDPSVFEVKFPDKDIKGKVVTY